MDIGTREVNLGNVQQQENFPQINEDLSNVINVQPKFGIRHADEQVEIVAERKVGESQLEKREVSEHQGNAKEITGSAVKQVETKKKSSCCKACFCATTAVIALGVSAGVAVVFGDDISRLLHK